MSMESLWGPTPCDRLEVTDERLRALSPSPFRGKAVVSGYLTIFSLCCWSASKKRSNAVGGRWSASAIREVNLMESVATCRM